MMPPMQWIGVTVIVIGQLCMAAVTIVLEGTIVDHWPMWAWIVIAAVTGIAALTLHFIYMRMMKRSNQDPFSTGTPPDPGRYSEEFLLRWQVNRITFNQNVLGGAALLFGTIGFFALILLGTTMSNTQ